MTDLFHIVELERLGEDKVRVTLSGVGYRQGDKYDAIFKHFAQGNPWSLRKLYQRFAHGPVDWRKLLPSTRSR